MTKIYLSIKIKNLNLRIFQNKQMCQDINNLQDVVDKRNNEINMLRNDISNLIEDNEMLKKEAKKLELTVSF